VTRETVAQALFQFGISQMCDAEGITDWAKLPNERKAYWHAAADAALSVVEADAQTMREALERADRALMNLGMGPIAQARKGIAAALEGLRP
jgi:hypothetical protein